MGEKLEGKRVGQRLRDKADETVRAVAAGMSIQDLRGMFRGEPPGRPNPRSRVHTTSFWFHMKPRWYPKSVTRFTYTFALGWFTTFLAVVLGVTGFILMVYYTPSTDMAYLDMLNIISTVPFGKLMRDVHRLAAELMVITVALHMLRVFVTASYKAPRSFNWLVGVALLIITVVFSYSGYLLPWDQIAYWAVTIGTSIADSIPVIGGQIQQWLLGGQAVGQMALLRFYTLHVIILPIALSILFGVHYYKVVRQGISLPPAVEARGGKKEDEERIPTLPDILIREVMWVMLGTLLLLIPVLTFYSAPLEDQANPFVTPLHSTAPWYFLWVQGLIKLPDIFGGIIEGKLVYGVIVPTILVVILFALPYLDRNPSRRWQDRKIALGISPLVIIALVVLSWMGTPSYGLVTAATESIALEFVPFDRHGAIHELAWDDLVDGVYDTRTFSAEIENTKLTEFMAALSAAMDREAEDLAGGVATLTITTWQRDLKRADLDIVWEMDGEEQTSNAYTYIHKDAID